MSTSGGFPSLDVDLQLIMLAGGLVIVDRSCGAFDPVHAWGWLQQGSPDDGADEWTLPALPPAHMRQH
jgi:hypothetical protein